MTIKLHLAILSAPTRVFMTYNVGCQLRPVKVSNIVINKQGLTDNGRHPTHQVYDSFVSN